MSDNSRSRVTVTLGRSGRVVKRGAEVPDDGFSNGFLMAGRKRSVRDRLGVDSYDRNEDYNKRHRGESFSTSRLNDVHLDKHDLRFRLMQKSRAGQSHNNGSHDNFDLRDKLLSKTSRLSAQSKTVQPPEAIVSRWQHEPEHIDVGIARRSVLDPRDTGRDAGMMGQFPSSRNTSDFSSLDTGRTYSSLSMSSLRRRSPERLLHPSRSRRLSPERNREEVRRSSPERLLLPSMTRRLPPGRNREELRGRSPERLLHPSTTRRLSPQRNRDELQRRSPERLMRPSTTRRLSPERIREELQRRPSIRTFDDGRSSTLRISPSRPANSPYFARSSVPDTSMKSVAPFGSLYPQTSGVIPKIPSMGVEHPTVESFLRSLGLEKYAILFKAEEIDMNSLRQLGDQDLKDLGIPMGPRKKIIQSIIPRFRRLP